MYPIGPLRRNEQALGDELELIYNGSVRIQDVV